MKIIDESNTSNLMLLIKRRELENHIVEMHEMVNKLQAENERLKKEIDDFKSTDIRDCSNCKYCYINLFTEPCDSCDRFIYTNWNKKED